MAGFNTAITGLKSSSAMLDVAGDNIANSGTVGYKTSRTEFSDIYTSSVVGSGTSNTPGSGATVSDIAQDFSGGTLEFTNNNLDLAINGAGFFQLSDGQGGTTYTRAGAFELDKNGFIVSKNGKRLQGRPLDGDRRLPLGDLAVTQKESPPQATSKMNVSFNIDARKDAGGQLENYDPTQAKSSIYSTTVRTFDSLGNEHTIKYNFVKQRPQNQVLNYSDATKTAAGANVVVSGVDINGLPAHVAAPALPAPPTPATPTTSGDFVLATAVASREASNDRDLNIWVLDDAKLKTLQDKDPRIKTVEYHIDGNTPPSTTLKVIMKSDARELGSLIVTDGTDAIPSGAIPSEFTSSNEKQYFEFAADTYGPDEKLDLKIAGVNISINTGKAGSDPMEAKAVAQAIIERQTAIVQANPAIEGLEWDPKQGPNGALKIIYKPDISLGDEISSPASVFDDADGGTTVFRDIDGSKSGVQAGYIEKGDNSYNGVYHMYAYLNNNEALNIGKANDPGDPSGTEPGPIVVRFNPKNGLLSEINGKSVSTGGAVPLITVEGADPADKSHSIELDISGSSQFASDSIIKASDQNGYAKGDLIGVSFSDNGEMKAAFSNGEELGIGVVTIATFQNQAGLRSSGDTEWSATSESGPAALNEPGTGLSGLLRSASLEQSNVDLSAELVRLIEAQRNYQANSKTLETLNTVTQSILQI